MGRFEGGLRCTGWVNSVITQTIYRCYLKKYNYTVKTCMYTINALHQIINLNISSKYEVVTAT